jgi:2EXR family
MLEGIKVQQPISPVNCDADFLSSTTGLAHNVFRPSRTTSELLQNQHPPRSKNNQKRHKWSSTRLPTFTLFSELPLELQQKIWRHTLPGPRIVELCKIQTVDPKGPFDDQFVTSLSLDKYGTVCKLPIALRVCQVSRGEALRVYDGLYLRNKSALVTYINAELDTIFLTSMSHDYADNRFQDRFLFQFKECNQLQKIRSLAVDVVFWRELRRRQYYWLDLLIKMEALREIIIVSDCPKSFTGPVDVPSHIIFVDGEEEEEREEIIGSITGFRNINPDVNLLLPKLKFKGKRRVFDDPAFRQKLTRTWDSKGLSIWVRD